MKKGFIKTTLLEFINENVDLTQDYAIRNLFNKYDREYEDEYTEENWIEYAHSNTGGMQALRESLELIGDGEIITKDEDHLMYKEMFKDDTRILVVHAKFTKQPYGSIKGYGYEIGVYINNPRTQQIGGGYGTSGIVTINHTQILGYSDYGSIHYNRNIISRVCADIKKYSIEQN